MLGDRLFAFAFDLAGQRCLFAASMPCRGPALLGVTPNNHVLHRLINRTCAVTLTVYMPVCYSWWCVLNVHPGLPQLLPKPVPAPAVFAHPQDVCYSWWCLSALSILGRLHWIDQAALTDFILDCQVGLVCWD